MSSIELLNWARGPGLQIALAIFILGMLVRVAEMWLLGRKADLSVARGSAMLGGWRTVFSRSVPTSKMTKNAPLVVIGGYIFHIGFFVTLLFFIPHIQLFRSTVGLSWPGLPTPVIDIVTIVSIAVLVALLINRIVDPVRRLLSTPSDYVAWTVTTLPLVTGYLTTHSDMFPYTPMLAAHILSVELLLVVFPFTKLVHAVTFIFARWYNGATSARKGVVT
jgi:nitrate reductase gamma subunit